MVLASDIRKRWTEKSLFSAVFDFDVLDNTFDVLDNTIGSAAVVTVLSYSDYYSPNQCYEVSYP